MAISLKELQELITPIIKALGYSLWGVELNPKKDGFLIRVFIDCDKGIALTDCEKVTKQLQGFFETEDLNLGEYILEVSSPGLDRPLFDLHHYDEMSGENVVIKLFTAFEGRKIFRGIIKGIEDSDVVIIVDDQEIIIPLSCIKKANIVPVFN